MWNPEPSSLAQLKEIFSQIHVADNKIQKTIYIKLNEISKHPEFPLYAAWILMDKENSQLNIRYTSGVSLNGYLSRKQTTLDENTSSILRTIVPKLFEDTEKLIRRASKLILTSLMNKIGMKKCEDLCMYLVNMINSNN